ncbi:MAG: EamA family transporter [Candidatus Omnitrophota bacterium]
MDWKIYALGSAFFAGLTAVLAKTGVRNICSNLATLIRTFVIIIFLGIVIGLRREWKNPFLIDRNNLIFLILSGVAAGLSWLCYFRALQSGPASLVASIDKLSLVFVVILSLLFLGEHLGIYQWLGICLITAGAFIIILK